jgi:hypothetical protein
MAERAIAFDLVRAQERALLDSFDFFVWLLPDVLRLPADIFDSTDFFDYASAARIRKSVFWSVREHRRASSGAAHLGFARSSGVICSCRSGDTNFSDRSPSFCHEQTQ